MGGRSMSVSLPKQTNKQKVQVCLLHNQGCPPEAHAACCALCSHGLCPLTQEPHVFSSIHGTLGLACQFANSAKAQHWKRPAPPGARCCHVGPWAPEREGFQVAVVSRPASGPPRQARSHARAFLRMLGRDRGTLGRQSRGSSALWDRPMPPRQPGHWASSSFWFWLPRHFWPW